MGPGLAGVCIWLDVCFSIRSFGSFDGTLEAVRRIFTRKVGFSIRSFGSFDGTAAEGLGIEFGREFQYPLFRII
mgnify:CR=1 FL=1